MSRNGKKTAPIMSGQFHRSGHLSWPLAVLLRRPGESPTGSSKSGGKRCCKKADNLDPCRFPPVQDAAPAGGSAFARGARRAFPVKKKRRSAARPSCSRRCMRSGRHDQHGRPLRRPEGARGLRFASGLIATDPASRVELGIARRKIGHRRSAGGSWSKLSVALNWRATAPRVPAKPGAGANARRRLRQPRRGQQGEVIAGWGRRRQVVHAPQCRSR